jgi:hypothetical protein
MDQTSASANWEIWRRGRRNGSVTFGGVFGRVSESVWRTEDERGGLGFFHRKMKAGIEKKDRFGGNGNWKIGENVANGEKIGKSGRWSG